MGAADQELGHDTWANEGGPVPEEDDSFIDQARQMAADGLHAVSQAAGKLSERVAPTMESNEVSSEAPEPPVTPEQ